MMMMMMMMIMMIIILFDTFVGHKLNTLKLQIGLCLFKTHW